MTKTKHEYFIKSCEKNVWINLRIVTFTDPDMDIVLKKVKKEACKIIEDIATRNGWITTFSGLHALIYTKENKQQPVSMIMYRPSFNYVEFDSRKSIADELKAIGLEYKNLKL